MFNKLTLSALIAPLSLSVVFACQAEAAGFDSKQIKQIDAGVLSVGYVDLGPKDGQPVILLHGWPYDINSFATVAPELAKQGYRVIVPDLRGFGSTRFLSATTPRNGEPVAIADDTLALMDALQWWYQFYFATPRGAAGYAQNTHDFAKLIWQQASPGWKFSDETFNTSAKSLDNPDHIAITLSNYRWRQGLENGEQKYAADEEKLAALPNISVPTITIEGDNNGAPHPAPQAYAAKFTGKYEHRTFSGNIGHNPPQEAPEAFVKAVVDASKL